MTGVSEHILLHQIVFDTVDDMGRLNDQFSDAILDHGFHRFFYRVDRNPVPLFQLSDDHLAGPGTVDGSIRIGVPDIGLNAVNGLFTGFVDAGAEAHDQDRFFRMFLHKWKTSFVNLLSVYHRYGKKSNASDGIGIFY